MVNEARIGFNRLYANTNAKAQLNPATFGILNGISDPIGLPQINIAEAASTSVDHPPTRRGVLTRCSSSQIP